MIGIEPLTDELLHSPRVVSLSGGKDSVALLLALREAGVSVDHVICADTGWESLEWYQWMERLPGLLGIDVVMVKAEISGLSDVALAAALEVEAELGISPSPMVRLMLKKGLFPSRFMRFCTDDLKALPMTEWLEDRGLEDAVHVTGVRAEESRARAGYSAVEWMRTAKQWHWRPILRWSLDDVIDIHKRHGMPLCPVYGKGVARVGCWPCIPARNKAELRIVAADARRARAITLLEARVLELKRAMHGQQVAEWQMFSVSLPGSDRQSATWAEAVQWAHTGRGGEGAEHTDGVV